MDRNSGESRISRVPKVQRDRSDPSQNLSGKRTENSYGYKLFKRWRLNERRLSAVSFQGFSGPLQVRFFIVQKSKLF